MILRMNAIALLVLALLLAGGCAARSVPAGPPVKPAVKKPLEDPRLRQVRKFFQRAPAEAMVMLVREPGGLADFINGFGPAMAHSRRGAELLEALREKARDKKVPLPASAAELAAAGIDPAAPSFMWNMDKGGSVADIGVTDAGRLLGMLARLDGKSAGTWQRVKVGGRTFSQDDNQSCFSGGGRLVCGRSAKDVAAYLDGALPARSAWSALDAADREHLAGADLIMRAPLSGAAGKAGGAMFSTLNFAPDGLGYQGSFDMGTTGSKPLMIFRPRGKSSVVGFARPEDNLLLVELDLAAILDQAIPNKESDPLAAFGLSREKLQKHLSGEVMLLERPDGEAALVVACSDRNMAGLLASAIVLVLQTGGPRANIGLKDVQASGVIHLGEGHYDLTITTAGAPLPPLVKLRLQPGPAGLVVGSPGLVKELASRPVPPPSAFTGRLDTVGRSAFGPRSQIGIRLQMADPFDGLISAAQVPASAEFGTASLEAIDLARMAFAQLQEITLGMTLGDGTSLRGVMHAKTLHGQGAPGDAEARTLYLKSVQARQEGDGSGVTRAGQALLARHPDSPYAGRLMREKRGQNAASRLMMRYFISGYVALMESIFKPWGEFFGEGANKSPKKQPAPKTPRSAAPGPG